MILVDTSIWVAHFRASMPALEDLLLKQRVLAHSWVIGELACGTLRRRAQLLTWLRKLPAATIANDQEVFTLIEGKHLWGKGIGWVDAHLLASGLITGCELWTRDQPLHAAAVKLGLAFRAHDAIQ
jgi:predicted nucleic acid-binding protein